MNSPLVSVIVTTYNSSNCIEECLQSIIAQSYPNIEIIVVDNNSTDNTKYLAQKYTDSVYNQGPERSTQRNVGVKYSQGEYVMIIDSDMELSKNVVKSCIETIHFNPKIKAAIVPEESFGQGFWIECKKLERSFYTGIDGMEAARFFEKKVVLKMGGYDEKITGGEDFDLPCRIEYEYGKESIASIKDYIYHNEQDLTLIKTCKKKFYYAGSLDMYAQKEANRKSFEQRASIIYRYKLFFGQPIKLFKNPAIGIGMLFMKACEFMAAVAGYLFAKIKK